jgi:hypothetical protein
LHCAFKRRPAMVPLRRGSLPAVNKTFVDREEPQRIFERAAFGIPADRARVLVFHGVGGQGKTALCRELRRKVKSDSSYGFLRAAELDLHGRPKTDPDLLLVWIRNGFVQAGVACPCFDLTFAIAWEATRGEQHLPKMDGGWLARKKEDLGEHAVDVLTAAKDLLKDSIGEVPILGKALRSIGGWAVAKGREAYLHRTREALAELYHDGELKKSYELSELLPWMLAQDLNRHIADHPNDRLVLLIDEYERVFEEGGAGSLLRDNPFDRHVRTLVRETNGLLAVFFSRERLPWDDDPVWRDELATAHHLLGGLADQDADEFLRKVPIADETIRTAMIAGARESSAEDAPVYALMLDLQVDHWRELVVQEKPIVPGSFTVSAEDFEGRRNEIVRRVLRDYSVELQATLKRLSAARRFDRAAFAHVVTTFQTGLPVDAFDAIDDLSFVIKSTDGFLTMHGTVADCIRDMVDPGTLRTSHEALFAHFSQRATVQSHREVSDATVTALGEACSVRQQLGPDEYVAWLAEATSSTRLAARYADIALLWRDALHFVEPNLGPEHPDTGTSLNNLAYLLRAQGDLAGAKPLCERALAISEKALGAGHPTTTTIRKNLTQLGP